MKRGLTTYRGHEHAEEASHAEAHDSRDGGLAEAGLHHRIELYVGKKRNTRVSFLTDCLISPSPPSPLALAQAQALTLLMFGSFGSYLDGPWAAGAPAPGKPFMLVDFALRWRSRR